MLIRAPRDRAPPCNGRIRRVASDGKAVPFASGFESRLGLRFIGRRMILCDINRDCIAVVSNSRTDSSLRSFRLEARCLGPVSVMASR
jgi:hypothetical protein